MGDSRGAVAGGAADDAVAAAMPEVALDDLSQSAEAVTVATRELLNKSRQALKAGSLSLTVPPALAGGRLAWTAPAGQVRDVTTRRLHELARRGELSEHETFLLVARFGLDGYPGGATVARRLHGRGRQATTDATNRALGVLAADIALQPLVPVERPSVDEARREEIVGTVLSTLHGPSDELGLRRYVHARVRSELLGHELRLLSASDDRQRQRWNRAAHEWIAVPADHLDRNQLPWTGYPQPDAVDEHEFEVWKQSTKLPCRDSRARLAMPRCGAS